MKASMDPTFFMESPWFNGVKLYPRQKQLAQNVYDMRALQGIYELIIAWGRRSGKTMMGSLFLSYGLYELLELPDPQRRFGLAPKSPIELDAVAKSGKQSKRTAFKQLKARIYTNPYFVHLEDIGMINVLAEEIRCPNDVAVYSLNSNAGSSVGGTVYMLIFEELVKFDEGESTKSASENYESLTGACATLAEHGAMSMVLSSIMHEEDIVMQLVKAAESAESMYGEIEPTWNINPHLPFNGAWIQNKLRNARDKGKFWREFGCIPEKGGYMYIRDKDRWKNHGITWDNQDVNWLAYFAEYFDQFPFVENEWGEEKEDISVSAAQHINLGLKPDPNYAILPHAIGGDPAHSGDSFGLALGTLVEFPYFKDQPKHKIMYLDGLYSFFPDVKLQELAKKKKIHRKEVLAEGSINPTEIEKMLMLTRANFNLCVGVFDTWNYPSIQSKLSDSGVILLRNTVKRRHYDALKDRAFSGQLRMVNFMDNYVLNKEMFKLIRKKNGEIDHPKGFGKDLSDAAANVNWALAEFFEGNTGQQMQPSVVAVV
jgi:hypothetical protein